MLTQFELGSAQRIARVVRAVEQQRPEAKPLAFGPIFQQRRSSVVFRMGTFTGAWSKNAVKTVTLRGTTATLSASNLFASIGTAASSRNCAIARDGTAWYLIAAEC